MKTIFSIILIAVSSSQVASGGIPSDSVRTWKDKSGRFSVQATLREIGDSEVTLVRKSDGKELTVPIDSLSDGDTSYLRQVAAEERTLKKAMQEMHMLSTLYQGISKELRTLDSAREPSQTDIQYRDEQKRARTGVTTALSGREFFIYGRVSNVQQAVIRYGAMDQLGMTLESSKDTAKRKKWERRFFDVTIDALRLPAEVPKVYRLKLGAQGKKLAIGDYVRIQCRFGTNKNRIGEFKIKLRPSQVELPCSSQRLTVISKPVLIAVLRLKSYQPRKEHPIIDTATSTPEQILAALIRETPVNHREGVVLESELLDLFGPPVFVRPSGNYHYWVYPCSKGRLYFFLVLVHDATVAVVVERPELRPEGKRLYIKEHGELLQPQP